VAHTLKDINFRFIINPHVPGMPDQGGQVSFREMPNGMVLIDRWLLRLAVAHLDTSYVNGMEVRRFYFASDVGGEVARAVWPDGSAWKASLGTVQLHVVTQHGEPARTAIIRLDDTDYLGSPNAKGDLEITDVLPGPYNVVIIDTALAPMGISLGTGLKLYAQRDSTIRAPLIEPPADAFLKKHCAPSTERHWVIARVNRTDGASVVDGTWELGEDFGTSLEYMYAKGRTGLDGEFGFCSDAPHRAGALQLRVSDNGMPHQDVIVVIQGTVTNLKIEVPARTKSP
ncbi:MAG: hypothetical protein ABI969_16535, partial [bacterium]